MAIAKAEKTGEGESDDPPLQASGHVPPSFWILALGSIGVVYGDIGTSPLYAIREAVLAATGKSGPITEPIVFGVLSLVIWALILVVTVKYVFILLNADNKGEGGTLSLMALAQRVMGSNMVIIPILAMIGAALFYGDAMITPAISVLSAVEGLKIITPALEPYVLPITLAIIIALFAVQARGTASVAALFGPITLVWFVAIAIAGIAHIGDNPAVLLSFNPVYAVSFLGSHGIIGLVTSVRCFWPSPAPRPSMPISATSANAPFNWPGSLSCSRPSCSTIWARARFFFTARRRSKIHSFS